MCNKFKSIETKYYEERQEFFDGLKQLDRRAFLRVAGMSAGIAAGMGLADAAVSFQLVSVAEAQATRSSRSSPSRTSPTRTCTTRSSMTGSCAPS